MVHTVAHSSEPTFPAELWKVYQWTCDKMERINNSVECFHYAIQSPGTNMHLETDIPPKEGKIFSRKGKIIMLKEETNQQARKKMYNSMNKIL